jgi:hypothetical protein
MAVNSSLASLHAMQDATHLLISIPPIPGVGDPVSCQQFAAQFSMIHIHLNVSQSNVMVICINALCSCFLHILTCKEH